jgi:transposase InsO family protein
LLLHIQQAYVRGQRRFTAATKSRHDLLVAENLLKGKFLTEAANKVWFSDISVPQQAA